MKAILGQFNIDPEVFFVFNFFNFPPIKLVMLDPQNTKNATLIHVFCAMFDRKGLDSFRVHNFGLFLISVQKQAFPQRTKNVEWYTYVFMIFS